MWKKYSEIIILVFIILVAIVTRFYKLGEAPQGLYVDEAGQGYSAYSILKTGKDEFGKSFPIVFRSLTDFKTPVFVYLIVPLIDIFGLNAFTVRFPSFFFSILTFPVLYLLIKELKISDSLKIKNLKLEIIASALLAISPWHILFGRTNFECNVALFFMLSGILAFYKALKNPKYLMLTAVMFAIAVPAYHSQRIITPLIVIALVLKHKKILFTKKFRFYTILSAIIGILISLPTISIVGTPGFLARASGLNIFTHVRQMPAGFLENYDGVLSFIVNSSWILTIREFLALYFSYLSPRYMFNLGDYGPRSSFPELATFFVWQFPFYIWGLYILLKQKQSEFKFLILCLLLISPIPAAVTRDPYSTIRSLPLVIPQIIIIALGIQELLKTKFKFIFTILLIFLYSYSLFKLYSSVIILNEYYRGKYWDYGWQEAVEVIKKYPDLPVVIDNARSDPDLILAFYLKYDPVKYQNENFEVPLNEYYTNLKRNTEKHIGNIITRPINWKMDTIKNQILVGDELAISHDQIKEHNLTLLKEIIYPSGEIALRVVKTNF